MTTIGQLVIRSLLSDSGDRYIMLDSQGWLQDASFSTVAKEYGIRSLSAGPCSEFELDRIRSLLSITEMGPNSKVALIVNTPIDADAWKHALGKDWILDDVQPITVFPGLDPELVGNLSLSEITSLLPEFGGEIRRPRSMRATAYILLDKLLGIHPHNMITVEGALSEAFRLFVLRQNIPPAWLITIKDDLPSTNLDEITFLDCFQDPDNLIRAIQKMVRNGALDGKKWSGREALLKTQLLGVNSDIDMQSHIIQLSDIDIETILTETDRNIWEGKPLMWWLDKAPMLGRMEILRESIGQKRIDETLKKIDRAFTKQLKVEYFSLLNTPFLPRPPILHKVPEYISACHPKDKTLLLIVDCLSIPIWQMLSEFLVEKGITPSFDKATFAWIPTITTVSRQALLSGRIPRDFGGHLNSTTYEETLWSEFWKSKGVPENQIALMKNADGKFEQICQLASDRDLSRTAIVFNEVDNAIHATSSVKAITLKEVGHALKANWVGSNLIMTVNEFLKEGWVVFLTSDHGAHKVMHDLGSPREGVRIESGGHRARIYSRDIFARDSILLGERWDANDTLPNDYCPVLAQYGAGYGVEHGWTHGGASWDEVIVPFVRFGGDAK